jgi:assimilatory nitrate reductase catalytic subunit
VCDVVLSETAAVADVVLPVSQWAEEEGTMTTLEGRVVRRHRALDPPPGVRDELAVLSELASRLGAPTSFSANPSEVFDELARASAGGPADYSGLSYRRLDLGNPEHWPCPAPEHPGTPRMFLERFGTPDGRAVLHPVEPAPVHDDVRPDAPLYLVTGRVLGHYQSGAQTRRVPELTKAEPTAYLLIHPLTAARLDIGEGELVSVRSSRGETRAPARLSTSIRPDVVFMPFHFPDEQCVNAVTDPATDPTSGMPQFKVCAVAVCRAEDVA